jgi:hypothetical protein
MPSGPVWGGISQAVVPGSWFWAITEEEMTPSGPREAVVAADDFCGLVLAGEVFGLTLGAEKEAAVGDSPHPERITARANPRPTVTAGRRRCRLRRLVLLIVWRPRQNNAP